MGITWIYLLQKPKALRVTWLQYISYLLVTTKWQQEVTRTEECVLLSKIIVLNLTAENERRQHFAMYL
jgi:hypothetical protein